MNSFDTGSESERPLLTFALFAYNQEQFIAEAVQGALSQTYSPLEIILSDDCSPDRTFAIMQEMAAAYEGPHIIILNRNEKNLGLVGHINRVMEMVNGEVIVVAAGDDISKSNRTEMMYQKFFDSGGEAFSIFSAKWEIIDENGKFIGQGEYELPRNGRLDMVYFGKVRTFVPGHSHAWHKAVFDIFGPISTDVISEDVVIPFRAALLSKVQYINEPLVTRRHHSSNLGGQRQPRKFKEKLNWYKKRQISLINNRIGIAKTFVSDIQTALRMNPDKAKELVKLAELNEKYLTINRLEIEYLHSGFLARMRIIFLAIVKYKMPFSRLGLWLLGPYSSLILTTFPINFLYKQYRRYVKSSSRFLHRD